MTDLSYNTDMNYFDNFNTIHNTEMRNPMNELDDEFYYKNFSNSSRMRKQFKNKKLLKTLSKSDVYMNRNNHPIIYNKVKKMAIEIDDLHKKLEREKMAKKCTCQDKYKNFNKEVGSPLLSNKNLAIAGVVALGFLLFTPYGQKLLK